ncbi:hypothetical protein [Ruminococcus flavefaciens]|uniref:hypothetical protein n=1 Tax=Ruminococcus flavefaciens TaxID=1265 RepID=UPI0026EEFDBA|nr:hypothetical protein [Ruminococcus flavefaciens]
MKKLFLILMAGCVLMTMIGCGTESLVSNYDDENINGSVIYVSPADDFSEANDAAILIGTSEA